MGVLKDLKDYEYKNQNFKRFVIAVIYKNSALCSLRKTNTLPTWHTTNPATGNLNRDSYNNNDIAEWEPRLKDRHDTDLYGKEAASFRIIVWYKNSTKLQGIKKMWLTYNHYGTYSEIEKSKLDKFKIIDLQTKIKKKFS